MKNLRCSLLLLPGIAFIVALATALFGLVAQIPHPNLFRSSSDVRPCTMTAPSLTAWTPTPAGEWTGSSGVLDGPSSLVFKTCTAGQIHMIVNGTVVDGWGPLMIVTLDDVILLEKEVRSRTSMDLVVPHAGTVRISFPNDRYRSEVRGVLLTRIWPQPHATCGRGQPAIQSRGSAPPWSPLWGGALYDSSEYLVHLCGPGMLRLGVKGLVAEGVAPQIRVLQGDQILLEVAPSSVRQYDVPVRHSGIVRITLTNGFAREVANRKLIIERFTVAPVN
ncbi:hypothetical protein Deipe_0918 [Deinococcus peraridilitoris DSM 19664]|uniref:Uncharacterized protein n=1 Tax=Deinococcus peraridilitoris (strain DSM 19664 / LMG 22246 / CIP 109416 / KR-200) TaxID=937777 RepID=K9ZY07_DEIPD|nr:hypothetical protein Deipe_0918 [Deinococcus peraridilitoris DSM 19664]